MRPYILTSLALLCVTAIGCGGNESYLPKPRPAEPEPEALSAVTAGPAASGPSAPASRPDSVSADVDAQLPVPVNSPTLLPGLRNAAKTLPEVDGRRRIVEQLTRVGKAFEAYREKSGGRCPDRTAYAGALSWRVGLLPYMGCGELLAMFEKDEPWTFPANRSLLARVPEVLQSTGRSGGWTNMVLLTGAETAYTSLRGPNENDFLDGLENTILAVEVDDAYARPWLAPEDYEFQRESVHAALFGKHKDCCYALFGGSTGVRRIPADISDGLLLALITPAGNESVVAMEATGEPTITVDEALIEELTNKPIRRFEAVSVAEAAPREEIDKSPTDVNTSAAARTEATPVKPADVMSRPETATLDAEQVDKRWPVPDGAAQQRAANSLREIYAHEQQSAKTSSGRRAWAQRMFEQTGGLAEDPAGMYVLLRAVRDVAAQAGDADTALLAIMELAANFRLDPLPSQISALEEAARAANDDQGRRAIYEHALRLGEQAVDKDALSDAHRLFALAHNVARSSDRVEDLQRVLVRQAEFAQLRAAQQRLKRHAYTLIQYPDDPAAHAAIGRYLCLVKGDWQRGLPRLVRGDDELLSGLAERESRPPTTPDQQVALADAWWEWADDTTSKLEQAGGQQRAVHWYRLALPSVSGWFVKSRIEKRLAEIEQGNAAPEAARLDDCTSSIGYDRPTAPQNARR